MQRYTKRQIEDDPDLDNKFYYKTRILKGYSYRYHFNVGKRFVVDEEKEASQSRFGQLTNWVQLPSENDVLSEVPLAKLPSFNAASVKR